jgi:hypothetical protein
MSVTCVAGMPVLREVVAAAMCREWQHVAGRDWGGAGVQRPELCAVLCNHAGCCLDGCRLPSSAVGPAHQHMYATG